MKRFYGICRLVLALACAHSGVAGGPPRAELIDALFSNPLFVDAKLSPDGRYLASISHYHGKRSVLVLDLGAGKFTGITVPQGQDIDEFHWIDVDTIVFHVSQWEVFTIGVYAYSVQSKRSTLLLDPQDTQLLYREVVDPLVHKEDAFVFSASFSDPANPSDLYLANGITVRKIAENTGQIFRYLVDADGQPMFAMELRNDEITVLRWAGKDKWIPVGDVEREFVPLAMLPDNRHLLVRVRNEEGFSGVNLLDLHNGSFPESDRYMPDYDLASGGAHPILDNLNGYVIGIHYNREKPGNFWFDGGLRRIEDLARTVFDQHVLEFLGYNPGNSSVYFNVSSDTLPPVIVQVGLKDGSLKPIYRQMPKAMGLEFRPTQPVAWKHGESELHGYLTLPEGEGPHPTVLLVHGGPWVRDTWGFDPEVQLLALSGYAVLQVNYRGSTGYGPAYALDGALGEIARVGVDDVISGAKWLIETRVADPARMAIMGGSFGGFISLEAAAREPGLWNAAVGFAGVYDLEGLYKSDKRNRYHWVDDAFKDYDHTTYTDLSPVNHAGSIRAPVLIIHGKNDQRVSVSQARDMVKALKKAGVPVESRYYGWGVHGLPEEDDRKEFYQTVLDFLGKQMDVAGR